MPMFRARFAVAADDEDLLSALLWISGCGGVASGGDGVLERAAPLAPGQVLVEGFYAEAPELDHLEQQGFSPFEVLDEADQDWLALWRATAQPIPIGAELLIEPGEPETLSLAPDQLRRDGRRRILVPARAAFGTGSHETTRLMLDALADRPPVGETMLDVGAGSGILSFVALALGATSAIGFEIDLESACLAGQNARLNQLGAGFWAGTLDALAPRAHFDLVVVNVLPERILDRAADLARAVAAGGRLLYGGHLVEREAPVVDAWAAVGLEVIGRATLGEWGLLELARR
jgi:ribosomal protein L11 methyltransferase